MKPSISPEFHAVLSRPFANPFSPDYSYSMLIQSSLKPLSNDEKEVVAFTNYCHNEYIAYDTEIKRSLTELKRSKNNLTDFVFCAANIKTLLALPELRKQIFPSLTITAEDIEFAKYRDGTGNEVSISLILEVTGDITAYLLGFINDMEFATHVEPTNHDFSHDYVIYNTIWHRTNHILNLEVLYGQVLFENATIEWSADSKKVKVSSGIKDVEMIRRCGEIRKDKNIQECLAYLSPIYRNSNEKKLGLKKYEVRDGEIFLTTGLKNIDVDGLVYDAHYIARYYYYTDPLPFYDGLTLLQINEVVKALVTIASEGVRMGTFNVMHDKVPYKITQEALVTYISKVTSLAEAPILKILTALTSTEKRPFPWRKPLYKVDAHFYFTLSTLNAPNPTLLFEEILRFGGYGIKDNEELLCDAISEELQKEDSIYTLEKIDTTTLVNSGILSKNHLLYKLRDYHILFEAIYYEHPITSAELSKTLSFLSSRATKLKNTLQGVAQSTPGEIIPLLASQQLSLSTLCIEDICLVDFQMISNYFTKGSFGRAQVVADGKNFYQANEFATINYYHDENQFNDNWLEFIFFPPQVSAIYSKLTWKVIPMSLPGYVPQITAEAIDLVAEENTVSSEIRIVKSMLDNKKFLDFEEKRFTLLDESIAYYINNILHTLAFKDYELSLYRTDLYKIISQSNFEGFSHMILFLNQALATISFSKIKRDKKFKAVNYNSDEVVNSFKKIMYDGDRHEISMENFQIPAGTLTKQEEKKCISSAIHILSLLTMTDYNDNDFDTYYLQIIVLNFFRRKYDLDYEFTQACSNYLSILNFNRKFQRARNFAEQILVISIPENKHYMGWSLLYKCFTEQQNPYYASMYGTLFNISLTRFTELKYSVAVELLASSLKFFRTFRLYDMMEQLMEARAHFRLDTYDDQKLNLIYFQGNLLKSDRNGEFIDEAVTYLETHSDNIKKYGEHAILPWLNLLYNIKRIATEGVQGLERNVDYLIEIFEGELHDPEANALKKMHFDTLGLKQDFIKALNGAYETYDSDDFRFEIRQLEMQGKRLLATSLENNDLEGILLSSLVLNDNSATYTSKYHEAHEKVRSVIDPGDETLRKISSYKEYVSNALHLKKGELLLWLFNLNHDVYLLSVDHEKNMDIRQLQEWEWKKMTGWLAGKKDFYFKGHAYPSLNEQEDHYNDLLAKLSFTELSLKQPYNEIYYCSSIDLVQFPHNLIINNNDFLSAKVPVSNVISFESFINTDSESLLSPSFTSTAWIPTIDQDGAILVSYDNLKPILDSLRAKIITDRSIGSKITTDVNIFLAHGELDLRSFKGIYTNHESESAIRHPEKLFGSGRIALLFICNSGVANDDILSNSVLSLCHDLLKLGYETVIAPFWKLEISITSFWFESFMSSFKEGYKISEAVYLANASLARYKEEISTAFYVAEGRLDMHLYGNPNIRIAADNEKNT